MELNTWTPFVPASIIPDEVKFVNVDTRDFHWLLYTGHLSTPTLKPVYEKFMQLSDDDKRRYVTTAESMTFLIQYIYDKTGGAGEWRHLCYKNSGRWLKYIWFIRVSDTEFAVYDRDRNFIDPNSLKDILNFDDEYAHVDNSFNDGAGKIQ